jgi:hypothetical protein
MHPVIAACLVLMAVGAALALRWGHLDVVPPWKADDEGDAESIGERLRRGLWFVAVHLYGAVAGGLLVLGPGGRLVMRLLAATAGDPAQGRLTEAEEVVGVVTVDGTISLVLFVGLFGGVFLAGLLLLLRKWLPPRRGGALVLGALFAVVASTRLEPLRPDNPDFGLVGPTWLAVVTFLATGVLTVLTIAAVAGRASRFVPLVRLRPRALLAYLPLVLLVPAAGLAVPLSLAGVLFALVLERKEVRDGWADRRVLLVGRIAIAAVTLAFLPSFVGDLASVVD